MLQQLMGACDVMAFGIVNQGPERAVRRLETDGVLSIEIALSIGSVKFLEAASDTDKLTFQSQFIQALCFVPSSGLSR